jgi:hypothetical protein
MGRLGLCWWIGAIKACHPANLSDRDAMALERILLGQSVFMFTDKNEAIQSVS